MLKIAKTIPQVKKLSGEFKGSVGFIPTMGYLHEGHLSLIRLSKTQNDFTIVSIFVNPTQFGSHEDLESYPRNTKRDLKLLKNAGVDFVLLPTAKELYPQNYKTYTEVTGLSNLLEGKSRPGHFRGVATIVLKLINITCPTRLYLGQKDAQQVAVIKKMVQDLNIPIQVVVGETIREKDGLAMSSRNVYLDKNQRKEATIIYRSLKLAENLFQKGERDSKKIKKAIRELIQTTKAEVDYISAADKKTLKEKKTIDKNTLITLAVKFGKTRLIDNIVLRSNSQ